MESEADGPADQVGRLKDEVPTRSYSPLFWYDGRDHAQAIAMSQEHSVSLDPWTVGAQLYPGPSFAYC